MSKQQQWMRNRAGGPLHKADISCESNGCWPVAVIDVEDREQVERLADLLTNARQGHKFGNAYPREIDNMQAALREFANPTPPKPEEPQGDGALIECDYTGKHGRAVRVGGSWTFYGEAFRDHSPYYEDFENVRVLSEGVEVAR